MSAPGVRHPSEFALGPYGWVDERLVQTEEVRVLPGARSRLNVVYARPAGWRPLLADLHLPDASDGPFPVVVYCHGGSFLVGDKAMEPAPWVSLPSAGIAVLSIDYRLAGEASHPEPIEDVRAAVQWVHDHAERYGLDDRRVAGWGSSAGAYLVGRVAFADGDPLGRPVGAAQHRNAELSCAVLHYPVTDFSTVLEDLIVPTDQVVSATRDVISRYLGFPMHERPDLLGDESLARCAQAAHRRPPILLQHGDADTRSGLAQSRRLHDELTRLGARSELVVVRGEDHATPGFAAPNVVRTVIDFLWRSWSAAVQEDGRL